MQLSHPALLKNKAYINGLWVESDTRRSYPVFNPYNGEILGRVPIMGQEETRRAIVAADQAYRSWSKKTAGERSQILRKWYELQLLHQEDLAKLLTMEQGKPIQEARGEIKYGASFVEWFAEEAKRSYGDVIPSHAADKRIITLKQAIGVVAAITPWNFPNAMITRKVAPALAAGCAVVVKPAEDTPLSALALAVLAEEAGIPGGIFNVITTDDPPAVGQELTTHPLVKKVSFTGSTAVGKILMAQSAGTVKKVSLELGGNAPFIVFEDADLTAAVQGAIGSKFRNAGQTCVCANRIYVQASIYEAFTQKLAQEVQKLKLGNGLEEDTEIGPLINQAAMDKVDRLVKNAQFKGARVLTGGSPYKGRHNFYETTVLTQVNAEMDLHKEEIFGPIAPVYSFETEKEVIDMANDTPFGLAAYFYGKDVNKIWRVAEALEYGIVGINTGLISTPVAPFGGMKESGIGREGSKYGIEEFMEIKYLCFGGIE